MPWWEPFEDIEKMRRRMERLMQKLGEPIEEEFSSFPVDISETDEDVVVKADLPGFEKEDVSIKATENSVEISAQHKEVRKEKTERMFRTERRFGAVRRAFTLPVAVNPDLTVADFKNGVLTLNLPKKEKKKIGKEIKIK